jgi:hypothetical protein
MPSNTGRKWCGADFYKVDYASFLTVPRECYGIHVDA